MTEILAWGQGIVLLLLGLALKTLWSINHHLGTLNGRLGRAETWQEGHDKQDDERHEEIRGDLHELWRITRARREP